MVGDVIIVLTIDSYDRLYLIFDVFCIIFDLLMRPVRPVHYMLYVRGKLHAIPNPNSSPLTQCGRRPPHSCCCSTRRAQPERTPKHEGRYRYGRSSEAWPVAAVQHSAHCSGPPRLAQAQDAQEPLSPGAAATPRSVGKRKGLELSRSGGTVSKTPGVGAGTLRLGSLGTDTPPKPNLSSRVRAIFACAVNL